MKSKTSLGQVRQKGRTLTEVTEQELRKAILAGEFLPGSQLPSEADLIDMLRVSRTTVREALRSLEEGGLILRRHGVGTFVLEHPIINNFGINYGVSEMIRMANMTPGTSEFNVTEKPASDDIAAQLAIEPGSMVKVVERIRTANDKPVVYSLDFMPISLFGGKEISLKLQPDFSLYDFLQNEFNIIIEYGVASITPVKANMKIAEKLAQKKNSILLFVCQIDYQVNDTPVLYTYEYNLPEAFNYGFLRRRPSKF